MYDCIVVGFGGIGSSALFHAAKAGWKVLGIDRFGVSHAKGSSHGQTRIIRAAYFEHPNYVPLCQKAFYYWDEVQASCRQNLITRTGLVQVGDPDGELIQGIQASSQQHGLEVETWSAADTMERFPIWKLNSKHVAVFEKGAGFLRVERCVAHLVKLAVDLDAEINLNDAVKSWEPKGDGYVVVTESGETYRTRRLIVAAGAWSESLLGLPLELKIVRKQQHWFQLDRIEQKLGNGFPCYLIESGERCFYGFPEFDYLGMKVAEHTGGEVVEDVESLDRSLDKQELERAETFLDEHFEFTRRRLVHNSICMYTKSSDEHFLIDRHPDFENVVFAAGMSGHGFKFSPVIGERLVQMLEGKPDPLFDFLKLSRFAES